MKVRAILPELDTLQTIAFLRLGNNCIMAESVNWEPLGGMPIVLVSFETDNTDRTRRFLRAIGDYLGFDGKLWAEIDGSWELLGDRTTEKTDLAV